MHERKPVSSISAAPARDAAPKEARSFPSPSRVERRLEELAHDFEREPGF
jgi:hypothetical protein